VIPPVEGWPRDHPAAVKAEDLLGTIDDLEPHVMQMAEDAWAAVSRLRHAAVRLASPEAGAASLDDAGADLRVTRNRNGSHKQLIRRDCWASTAT
jgi:hypothetical protein